MTSSRLQKLQEFLSASPDDSFILFAIAKEYEKLGQSSEALQHFLKLKDSDPSYVGTYYHLGKLYEKLGKAQEAWNTYTKGMAVAQAKGDQHARQELAGAKLYLGDEEDFE